jgi:hypothetical protein
MPFIIEAGNPFPDGFSAAVGNKVGPLVWKRLPALAAADEPFAI